jgi:DNA-binding CsgD family transcriptional regulator/predicted ATPase
LERSREVERLRGELGAAAAGQGSVCVIEGPAGIGKTALLDVAAGLAGGLGVAALRARGRELERDVPFGVVRQLFERRIVTSGQEQRQRLLAGAAGLSAPVVDPAHPLAAERESANRSFSVLHGLYWLCANLAADSPLALLVDDVQWADGPSLRWLNYLTARLEGVPVVLILAWRPGEPGGDVALLDPLLREPSRALLRLGPLSERAAGELIAAGRALAPDPEFVAAAQRVTAGNPFFLHELIRALSEEHVEPTAAGVATVELATPAAVSRAVLLRLVRLGEEAGALARAVAVLDGSRGVHEAAALAGLDDLTAARCADQLAQAGVLEQGSLLDFAHPIVRSAVYAELPAAERGVWHARAARVVAEGGGEPGAVAAHLLLAEPAADRWALEQLRAAGRAAGVRGAPQLAVACLRRALEESPAEEERAQLLLELGSAEAAIESPAAIAHLREALRLTSDPAARASAALELARNLIYGNRMGEALEALDRARDSVRQSGDRRLEVRLESRALEAAVLDPQARATVGARLARFEQRARGDDWSERLLSAHLAMEAVRTGSAPAAQAVAYAERALAGGALLAELTSEAPIFYLAAYALVLAGASEQADATLSAALDDARRRGSAIGTAIAANFRSLNSYRAGRLLEAEADARQALELALETGFFWGVPRAVAFLIDVHLERGELEQADELLQQRALDGELPPAARVTPLLLARGRLRLAQGKPGAGLADLGDCRDRCEYWGDHNPAMIPWRSATATALADSDPDTAHALAKRELDLAEAFGEPRALGIALRAAAVLDRGERRRELLERAIEALRPSPARLELAHALVDLGSALRRAGYRADARAPLRESLDLADRAGASRLTHRAQDELQAAGARPRRERVRGTQALTPGELRVAGLAAQGMSNREIAQALFVSLRTVETHLTHAYQKLDIDTRTQLADALSAEDPHDPLAAPV